MPRHWCDSTKCNDDEFQKRISAHKKPYFMKYIYPETMKKYNVFMAGIRKKCLREFGISFEDMVSEIVKTEEENNFLKYYDERMPVGVSPCVMNRICRLLEKEFDGAQFGFQDVKFDSSLLKSGVGYSESRARDISGVYDEYLHRMKELAIDSTNRRVSEKDDLYVARECIKNEFSQKCELICPNKYELCDIVVDLCYNTNKSKQFAWDVCGSVIIENLLNKRDNTIAYPVVDEFGDIVFNGNKFSMKYKRLEED